MVNDVGPSNGHFMLFSIFLFKYLKSTFCGFFVKQYFILLNLSNLTFSGLDDE